VTRDEALAILKMSDREQAIDKILELAQKAEKYDALCAEENPLTPSGMKPVYSKPSAKKRKRRPGQKKGHQGQWRKLPLTINERKEHTLCSCPHCQNQLGAATSHYKRYTEEIPPVELRVIEHTVYRYWCSICKRFVSASMSEALPNAVLGIRLVVFSAWLHYLVGISVNNVVKILSVFANAKVSAGGLTLAWKKLAALLKSVYDEIGDKIKNSAALNGDETGWRLNGATWWLWCFANQLYCYYVITKSRGSPVLREFFGQIYKGVLICDFWPAYNTLCTLAKQRCLYHLFTELAKVDKYNKSKAWKSFRKTLSRLLKDAIRLWDKQERMPVEISGRQKRRLYVRLDSLLKEGQPRSGGYPKEKDVQRLIKRLRRHQTELFTFLEYEGVSPYNNHAERQIRSSVISRKISQQNRSEDGAKTQAILMSLFKTAQLQKKNPVEYALMEARKAIELQVSVPQGKVRLSDQLKASA